MLRVRAVLLIGAALATTACGALLSLEPLEFKEGEPEGGLLETSTPPDRDTGVVTPIDAGNDAPSDGGDGGPSSGFCDGVGATLGGATVLFCDDFERAAPVEKGWVAVTGGGGTVSLTTVASISGASSLAVELPSGASASGKQAYLATPTIPAGAKTVTVEMDIRLDVSPPAGTYPSNGFEIGRSYNVGNGFEAAFVTVPVAGTFNPGSSPNDTPPAPPFVAGQWHHFKWSVVNGAMTLEVTPKAGGAAVVRTDTQPQDPAYFKLGAETAQSLGPVKMLIDDVVMYR